MSRLNKRKDFNLCDTNCQLLTLAEAVKRWTSDGQFLMTEVNGTDSYQSPDPNIDIASYSARISKIEAALKGMDFVKDTKAPEATPAGTEGTSAGAEGIPAGTPAGSE